MTTEKIFQAIKYNDIKTFSSLIDQVNINSRNYNGETFLMIAVENKDNIDIVKVLINKGIDLFVKSNDNNDVFNHAIRNHSYNMIRLLLKIGFDKKLKNRTDILSDVMRHVYFDPNIVQLLVNCSDLSFRSYFDETVLFYWNTDILPIDYLLSKPSCNINSLDSRGRTALFKWLIKDQTVAKKLIDLGSDINIKDINGATPLVHLIDKGSITGLKFLLKYKHLDKMKNYSLWRIIFDHIPYVRYKIVKLLAKHQIGNFNDYNSLKQLDINEIRSIFKYVNIDSNIVSRLIFKHTDLNLIKYPHINFNYRDKNGMTLLIKCAADPYKCSLLKEIVDQGSDVNIKDNNGKSFWDYLRNKPIYNTKKMFKSIVARRNKELLLKQCIWYIKNNRDKFDDNRLKKLNKDLRKCFFV